MRDVLHTAKARRGINILYLAGNGKPNHELALTFAIGTFEQSGPHKATTNRPGEKHVQLLPVQPLFM